MIKQLPLKQSHKWHAAAIAAKLLLVSFACSETQDDVSSGYTEIVPDDTRPQHSDDVDVSANSTQASSEGTDALADSTQQQHREDAEAPVDNTQAPPGDSHVDLEYIQWVLENPAAQFVSLYFRDPDPYNTVDEAMYGFLWIEYPCVYLQDPEPLPLDIQSVVDLDLDLERLSVIWLTG